MLSTRLSLSARFFFWLTLVRLFTQMNTYSDRSSSTHTTLNTHTRTQRMARLDPKVFGSVTRETAQWQRKGARARRRRKKRAAEWESGRECQQVERRAVSFRQFLNYAAADVAAHCYCLPHVSASTSAADCYFSLTLQQQQQHTITFVRPRVNCQEGAKGKGLGPQAPPGGVWWW